MIAFSQVYLSKLYSISYQFLYGFEIKTCWKPASICLRIFYFCFDQALASNSLLWLNNCVYMHRVEAKS